VTRFLSHLAVEGKVSASTQNQALSALVFLYKDVLDTPVGWLSALVRAKRPLRVPVVFTKDEVRRVFARLKGRGTPALVAGVLYGTGMRLLEALRLRVKDIDFAKREVVVRGGKGDRDRVTMLAERLEGPLRPTPRRGRHPLVYGAGFFLILSLIVFLARLGMVWVLIAAGLAVLMAITAFVLALRGPRASA
jgi:integrase